MEFIYLLYIIIAVLLLIGFYFKEYAILAIASIMLMAVGVYILANGFLGIKNLAIDALGTVSIALGFYICIRGALELIKNKQEG